MDRQDAGACVVVTDRTIRVHWHACRARPVEINRDASGCLIKRLFDFSETKGAGVGLVLTERLMHEGRTFLTRLERIEHRRQDLVLDLDQIAGVFGDVAILGYDSRDALAIMAHLLDRNHVVLNTGVHRERRQRVCMLLDVLARQDAHDAGESLGLRGVDALDASVRVRAALDRCVQHVRQRDVIDIAALATQEARVLNTIDALPNPAQTSVARCGIARNARGIRILFDLHDQAPFPADAAARIDSTIC